MKDAVTRAVELFKDKEKWISLTKKVMNTDFSWNVSATEYLKMYENLSKVY